MFSTAILILLILLTGGTLAWFYQTDRRTFTLYGRRLAVTLARVAAVAAIVWGIATLNSWWVAAAVVAVYSAWATAWAFGHARIKRNRLLLYGWGVGLLSTVTTTSLVAAIIPCHSVGITLAVAILLMITQRRTTGHGLQMLMCSLNHTKSHTHYLRANGATVAEALRPSLKRALRAAVTRLFSASWWTVMGLLWLCMGGMSAPTAALIIAVMIAASAVASLATTGITAWIVGSDKLKVKS